MDSRSPAPSFVQPDEPALIQPRAQVLLHISTLGIKNLLEPSTIKYVTQETRDGLDAIFMEQRDAFREKVQTILFRHRFEGSRRVDEAVAIAELADVIYQVVSIADQHAIMEDQGKRFDLEPIDFYVLLAIYFLQLMGEATPPIFMRTPGDIFLHRHAL